ncbi:IPT/TIG domain-containing protein [Bacteroides clarus]
MKYNRIVINLLLSICFLVGCDDKEFGEGYDLNLPVSVITDIKPVTEYIDGEVILTGKNLSDVTSVFLGNISCEILEVMENGLKIKIDRSAERNKISIVNKYKKEFESSQYFTPLYYDVEITSWPSKLEKGKTFSIQGKNVDLITKVQINDIDIERVGNATPQKVTYSLKDLSLDATAVITIKTRTNQVLVSSSIEVVEPSDVFVPSSSIWLCDFDNINPIIVEGNPSGAGATYEAGTNLSGIAGAFGSYYTVKAPLGNAWNGVYQELVCNNDGKGFDLSSFTKPYITFLVNTNGKQGYFNPRLTVNGESGDKHFTGQGGEYNDNYKFTTNGWEWRSYDLTEMGFNVSGVVESIDLLIRGANVGNNNSEAFEVNIDQVMITDGALLPTVLWDFSTKPVIVDGSGELNSGTGVTTAGEGEHYLTIKSTNVEKWASLGKITRENISAEKYANSLYVNFLVNTGIDGAEGYAQLIFLQNDSELGKHFKGENVYGDDYKFASTHGNWEWRSYQIDPKAMELWSGEATELDLMSPFDLTVEFKTGNVQGKYELNIDYVVLTAAPLDNK